MWWKEMVGVVGWGEGEGEGVSKKSCGYVREKGQGSRDGWVVERGDSVL